MYSERGKSILNILRGQDVCNISIAGSLFKKYFKEKEMALFLMPESQQTYLLYKNENIFRQGISFIVELISILETAEKRGYLYCIKKGSTPKFVYEPTESTNIGETGSKNEYQNSMFKLIIIENNITLNDHLGHILLNGHSLDTEFSIRINYYLCNYLYPTKAFCQFVDNGCESIEVQSYKKQISDAKFSRNMAWTALFVSLLSPFGMTFFNNKYAKTEIHEGQFNLLLNKIDTIKHQIENRNDSSYQNHGYKHSIKDNALTHPQK